MDMNKHQYLQCSSWLNRCHIWYNEEIKDMKKQHPHLEFSIRHDMKHLASKKPLRKSCQVFVKWVRGDGTSIIDPSFCYQVGKKYTCSDFKKGETVDTGYHLLPVDVALSFGIQFGLFPLKDVSLLFVTLCQDTAFACSHFRLYSTLRVSSLTTVSFLSIPRELLETSLLKTAKPILSKVNDHDAWLISFLLVRREQSLRDGALKQFSDPAQLLKFNMFTSWDVLDMKQTIDDVLNKQSEPKT